MKSFVLLVLTSLSLSAVEPQSLRSFESVPPDVRLHFSNLCLGRYGPLFEDNERGLSVLATNPGLTPALLELASRREAEQEWNGFTLIWGLLAKRTDATNDEQRFVREKLEGLLNRNADPGGTTFKRFGLTFLGNYPSDENERLLVQYLSDTNGSPLHGNSTREAAESLGKIGTAASIEALRAYAEKRKPPPDGKSRSHETAVVALEQIMTRLQSTSTPAPTAKGNSISSLQPANSPVSPANAKTVWIVGALTALALVAGILWMRLRTPR